MSQLTNHVSTDNASEVARLNFAIRAALSGVRTAIPVKVISCTNSGGVSPIGTVTVQPLVSAMDGNGQLWPHGEIAGVPYLRIQGGGNAVIIDPQAGDIGIASICDRDISKVKNTGAVSGPGSTRKHDMSDMVYLMTIIGAAPTQYVEFNGSGITITSPNAVQINAQSATVNAPTVQVNASGSASVASPSISLGATGQPLLSLVNENFKTLFNEHTHTSEGVGSPTSVPNQLMDSTELTSTVKGG